MSILFYLITLTHSLLWYALGQLAVASSLLKVLLKLFGTCMISYRRMHFKILRTRL